MYRVCSLCPVVIEPPDCPIYIYIYIYICIYALLQMLRLSLYIPLEFVLVLANLSVSYFCGS